MERLQDPCEIGSSPGFNDDNSSGRHASVDTAPVDTAPVDTASIDTASDRTPAVRADSLEASSDDTVLAETCSDVTFSVDGGS